jgi:hypothetical protein
VSYRRPANTMEEMLRRKAAWQALSLREPMTPPKPVTLADVLPPVEPQRTCSGCREMSYTRSHAKACPLGGGAR